MKTTEPILVLAPRTDAIGALIADCAHGKLPFSTLYERVSAMGYKTTSLYEMVRAAELNKETPGENPK